MPPDDPGTRNLDPDERRLDAALDFRPCPLCERDVATREGTAGCRLYDCPYLPEELDVVCPTCNYNFYTDETVPECGDPPTCDFALNEAPERLAALEVWLEEVSAARGGRA